MTIYRLITDKKALQIFCKDIQSLHLTYLRTTTKYIVYFVV